MSIHQPRYSIFKLFDTLTLLSEGTVVYHGPNRKALEYFGQYGKDIWRHSVVTIPTIVTVNNI